MHRKIIRPPAKFRGSLVVFTAPMHLTLEKLTLRDILPELK
jgi:hypothetical protein